MAFGVRVPLRDPFPVEVGKLFNEVNVIENGGSLGPAVIETFSLATGRPPCWWVVPVSSGPMPFVTISLVFMASLPSILGYFYRLESDL